MHVETASEATQQPISCSFDILANRWAQAPSPDPTCWPLQCALRLRTVLDERTMGCKKGFDRIGQLAEIRSLFFEALVTVPPDSM